MTSRNPPRRGRPIVTATTGSEGPSVGTARSKTVTCYFRGMSDDVLADPRINSR
ncbi:hypothetical protein [Actinacidiphila glaucinigra]|uniref:hypothetical protein n=1 Tax=Actinacidiphila glaucinigra TaxID=235986 RepID=UPI003670AB7E